MGKVEMGRRKRGEDIESGREAMGGGTETVRIGRGKEREGIWGREGVGGT